MLRLHPLIVPRAPRVQGFTLAEVIVASAVGALVIIATTTVFAPQLRMHQRLEGRTRLQERWARVQYLLDTEIQEAHSVAVIANGLRLTTCAVPSNPSDTYSLANRCTDGTTSATGTPGTDVSITYVHTPGTQVLSRTGPTINRNGQLNTTSDPSTEVLTTGVVEFIVPDPVTARKDDAPAADQAATTNVAGWCWISGVGGLIQTTSG